MKNKKISDVLSLALVVMLLLSFSGCAKNSGVQGGDFKKHDSLSEAFSAEGNTTVSLSQDETLDLTGIIIKGRKEIFLNNHTLKIVGHLKITKDGVIDIKPGEDFEDGVIDLGELMFALSEAPANIPNELPLIEIRPGVEIVEPQIGGEIGIQEFPDVLTVIVFWPAE